MVDWKAVHGGGKLGKSSRCPADPEHRRIMGLVGRSLDNAIDDLAIGRGRAGTYAALQQDARRSLRAILVLVVVA